MPQINPTEILANMARLKSSPSDANFANYDDIFAGPAAGHVPTAFEQATGDANADRAETAMGAGPAIDGLRAAADEGRRQQVLDIGADDADFMQHGMDRAVAHSNVNDFNSEAGAHRQLLPYAEQVHDRDARAAQSMAETRYLGPAQIAAQGNVQGRLAEANGRIGAVQAKTSVLPQEGLINALTALLEKNGKVPSPEEIAILKSTFGSLGQ